MDKILLAKSLFNQRVISYSDYLDCIAGENDFVDNIHKAVEEVEQGKIVGDSDGQ